MKSFVLLLALAAAPTFAQPVGVRPEGRATSLVSDAEKPGRCSDAIKRIRVVLREVVGRTEEARKSKDIVKLNCVNEKLTQIKGLLRISEKSEGSMKEALDRREATTAESEFAKVMLARGKVDQLRAEVEQCIGELAYRADENLLVEVEIPGDLPLLDPTRPGASGNVTVRAPPSTPPPGPDPLIPNPPASPTL
jgi:hypothetical protein